MTLFDKIDVQERYNLPNEIKYCKKCVISNQRPRIAFDDEGICNACRYWENKDNGIDWDAREAQLVELLNKHRRSDGRHDIIVPSSGGKDSAYVAHVLKYKYDMNPLTVTWAPHLYTDIGRENFHGLVDSGLDNILATANGIIHRKLTRLCTIEMGEPFQPFIYGQVWFPVQIAVNYGIPLIIDGENGDAEYGGDPESEERPGFTVTDADMYWFSGRPIEYWFDHGFSRKDLALYMPPDLERMKEAKIERHFLSYYIDWRPQKHYYYAAENTGFKANPNGRSEGTYSKYASLDDKIDPFHYYFMLLKFGISRATSDAAHEIREGLIERDEAVALVRKYDAEFPKQNFKTFLEYCQFNEEEFWSTCERWRNENLWEQGANGWNLRQQVR
jgi:N-acetyl sugar amidotransferase